ERSDDWCGRGTEGCGPAAEVAHPPALQAEGISGRPPLRRVVDDGVDGLAVLPDGSRPAHGTHRLAVIVAISLPLRITGEHRGVVRRARSTTGTAGSGGSPPASPPTPLGAPAQSRRGSSRCFPSPRHRGR